MRRKVVAGNWKMHGSSASVRALMDGLDGKLIGRDADVVLFPPAVFLVSVVERARRMNVAVGAQSIHSEARGAFTGEIAAEMVSDIGATHALVGHSERRHGFGESDAVVAAKFGAARRAGLVPVLCVGETLAERDAHRAIEVVRRQVAAVIERHGIGALTDAVIAYEPVWAIGTGQNATPADAATMHAAVRVFVAGIDASVASTLRILYGGSVTRDNARALLSMQGVDGVLVGGASLDAAHFAAIYESV